MNGVSFLKKYMNGVSFSLKKYMNGSCFSLSLVYEWGGVRGLQPHIRTQNHGKFFHSFVNFYVTSVSGFIPL